MIASLPALAQEQKNVKLLTGMSAVELQRTMNFIRASLGVHCDYCHVVDDKTGWDFASDDKKNKLRARDMISMTIEENQKYFGGHSSVTCTTCHRGSTRPASQPTLPQEQPPFPTPVRQKPELTTTADVIDRYAKALGKIDANKWSTLVLTGTRETPDGSSGTLEVTEHGPSIRVHFVGKETDTTQVVTADGGWVRSKDGVRDMRPSEVENFRSLRESFRIVLPSDIPADAKVTDRMMLGDTDTWVVSTPQHGRLRERLYFDTTSGLLVHRVILMETPIGDVAQQTDYADYRDVDGTRLPFLITVASVDPWIGSTRKLSDVRLGAKVDDGVFKK